MTWLVALGWLAAGGLAVAQLGARARLASVARASHELRGPLCAARLGLHALAGGVHAARVAAIDLELSRAALALEDLGRRRPAPPRVERFDVCALVLESAPAWRAAAHRHGARLAVDAGGAAALVSGDRLRLAQAVANLVANAAEHGGGLVRVAVREASGCVRVEVRDDGPGLPAPVGALAGRGRRRRRGRRGHGLAVAATVADAHGGRLAAAPARAGARVVLELPAAAVAQRPAPGRRRRARPHRVSG